MKAGLGPRVISPVRRQAATILVLTVLVLMASALPLHGSVVYTVVNMTVTGSGTLKMDLNHDGINDFSLQSTSQITVCGNRGGLFGSTKIIPTSGDGVVIASTGSAAVLTTGIPVNGSSSFSKATSTVTSFLLCEFQSKTVSGYLGLEFQISGQTHYGWANISIHGTFGTTTGSMTTTLVSFAYETVAGKSINTGQTSADALGVMRSQRLLPDEAPAPDLVALVRPVSGVD